MSLSKKIVMKKILIVFLFLLVILPSQAKVKPKAEPKPAKPKIIKKSEVYEKHTVEGEVEIGRKKVTRDDGTAYWEVEYSDGSMMDIPIE